MERADIPLDAPIDYEIVVRGALDPSWSASFEGMTLAVTREDGPPITLLRGLLVDQAALAGVLDRLFGLNVTVLSVNAVSRDLSDP